MPLDLPAIRRQFPFLAPEGDGSVPVYLDTAATMQKPSAVLEKVRAFYEHDLGNAHRGLHAFAERATVAYEDARMAVQQFLHVAHSDEIVFTKNATDSINLVARSYAAHTLKKGDRILLTLLEHSSNIVPWLQLKEEHGIEIAWIDIDDDGRVRMDMLQKELNRGDVKLVAVTGQSNVLGTRPDLRAIINSSHDVGAVVLVDAAQLVAHAPVDAQDLDCDFLAFSGHKLGGPTGIGVLYGKRAMLREMPPFLGGGGMVEDVRMDGFTPLDPPQRFEAGSMPAAEAVGLHAALDWLAPYSWTDRIAHEQKLLMHAINRLRAIEGLRILGPADAKEISAVLSFTLEGVHPHDLTDLLGQQHIALRAGQHCAALLHDRLSLPASTRLSVGIYTTIEEIDRCVEAIEEIRSMFAA